MKVFINNGASSSSFLMVSSCMFLLLPSCLKEEDPSYEKEALKLSAEKAALEVRLEESQKQVESLQAKVSQAESQARELQSKATQVTGEIDSDKIKLGFAKAMGELEEKIESNFPHLGVKSCTVQSMNVQTDYPFSSGVMTTLVNKSTGEVQEKYWAAKGNTKGEWLFEQTEAPQTKVASSNGSQPKPTVSANPAPSSVDTTSLDQPEQPNQPTRPKPKPAADGNTHVIDWGSLR